MKLPVCSPQERQTGSFATGAVLGEMERWQWPRLNSLRLRSAAPEELLSSSQDHSRGREDQLPILQISSLSALQYG